MAEAEWEYAAAGGTSTAQHWGAADLSDYAWIISDSGGLSHPCGVKLANAYGLPDMFGNVWEWCEDDWHADYTAAPLDGSAYIDAPRIEDDHILRGGNWNDALWSVWTRAGYNDRNNGGGFRLAFDAP